MRDLVRVVGLVVTLGCGGDDTSLSGPVVDLSTADQESLCDAFVASICAKADFASFCDACVTGAGCAMAASTGAVETECMAPITAEMVASCGDSGVTAARV